MRLPIIALGLSLLATPTLAQTAPKSFGQCARCHNLTADGKNKAGPRLYQIFGKAAAQVRGFNYSSALTQSGLRWDEKTLDAWIANPKTFVPGNKMKFGGEKDAAKRAEIIGWLRAN